MQTKRYFSSGRWVDSAEEATNFASAEAAQSQKQEHGLTDVELVYQFPSVPDQQDIVVPMDRLRKPG
jgi:hypothetical protein